MTDASVRLDHVGIGVRDLAAGAAAYQRLGFTLSPFAQHVGATAPGGEVVPLGTGNRCAMLRAGYLEIIAVVDPALPARDLDTRLALYEGVHIVAIDCDDPDAVSERLVAAGFGARGVQLLTRPVATPEGERLARFERVPLPEAEMPEGRVFHIRHLTPEVIWQPLLLDHANGALALTETVIRVEDLAEAAARYARFLDLAPRRRHGACTFALDRGRCVLVDEAGMAELLPGIPAPPAPAVVAFTVATGTPDRARGLLAEAGVAVTEHDGRLLIEPRFAGGACCLFEPA